MWILRMNQLEKEKLQEPQRSFIIDLIPPTIELTKSTSLIK